MKNQQQQGAVLFISLIILVLLTMLGLSSMRSTLLQEKMAANFKNKSAAFQGAETALRDGENWLKDPSRIEKPVADNVRVYDQDKSIDSKNKSWWWSDPDTRTTPKNGVAGPFDGITRKQRYAIQLVSSGASENLGTGNADDYTSTFYVYRISAIDAGASGISVLESYIKIKYK